MKNKKILSCRADLSRRSNAKTEASRRRVEATPAYSDLLGVISAPLPPAPFCHSIQVSGIQSFSKAFKEIQSYSKGLENFFYFFLRSANRLFARPRPSIQIKGHVPWYPDASSDKLTPIPTKSRPMPAKKQRDLYTKLP